MPKKELPAPNQYSLVEVEDHLIHGVILNRKIGQGIFIQRFGMIRVVNIGISGLNLSIVGINGASTP